MSEHTPSFTVDVDLTNPGQFLACCGLLELASRLNADAVGWFDGDPIREFHLSGGGPDVIARLADADATPITPGDAAEPTATDADEPAADAAADADEKAEKSPPMRVGGRFDLRLDWYLDPTAVRAGFKMWGAGMTVAGFFDGTESGKGKARKRHPGMRDHVLRQLPAGWSLLTDTVAVDRPSPFMFDSRLSRNTTIDLGFGGGVTFAFSPATELLAMVGLQRFRPRMEERWVRNSFHVWRDPLPVAVAAAVTAGHVRPLSAGRHEFAVKPRDPQGRYKAFGPARPQPEPERNDDR